MTLMKSSIEHPGSPEPRTPTTAPAADLYQILYCSRNTMKHSESEMASALEGILATSRINNSRVGVTGMLFFNNVFFAQVLEGPYDAVQRTFERILRDPRHSEITVLQSAKLKTHDFAEWSMAFASCAQQTEPAAEAAFQSASTNPSAAAQEVVSLLRRLVLQAEE